MNLMIMGIMGINVKAADSIQAKWKVNNIENKQARNTVAFWNEFSFSSKGGLENEYRP